MNTSVRTANKELRSLGYVLIRQRGSHMVYQHKITGFNVIVPSARGLQGGDLQLSKFKRIIDKATEGAQFLG